MTKIDVNEQWRELQENYAAMADDELEAIAAEAYDLTDIARKVLQAEVSRRNLAIELQLQAPAPEKEAASEGDIPADEEVARSEPSPAAIDGGDEEDIPAYDAHCPQCHSEEIIFRKLEKSKLQPDEEPKFSWRCEACGYRWKDDGIELQS